MNRDLCACGLMVLTCVAASSAPAADWPLRSSHRCFSTAARFGRTAEAIARLTTAGQSCGRRFLLVIPIQFVFLVAIILPLQAESPGRDAAKEFAATSKGLVADVMPAPLPNAAEIEASVKKGLDFLESRQFSEGYWQDVRRSFRRETTVWVILAFLANGHNPQEGPYRRTVDRALTWLVQEAGAPDFYPQKDGPGAKIASTFFEHVIRPHGSSIWGDRDTAHFPFHYLFACLSALGTGTKTVASEDLVLLCEQGVKDLIELQVKPTEGVDPLFVGGWYDAEPTYWGTLCLLAAKKAGISVPETAFGELERFWKARYVAQFRTFWDGRHDKHSSGGYDQGFNFRERWAFRALIALSLLGEHRSEELRICYEEIVKPAKVAEPWWFWENIERCDHSYKAMGLVARSEMGGHSRIMAEWFMALRLSGHPPSDLALARTAYLGQILACQNEDGSFRHPGRELSLSPVLSGKTKMILGELVGRLSTAPYPTPGWSEVILGYGGNWSEDFLTARALYGMGLANEYLPAFVPWRKRQ